MYVFVATLIVQAVVAVFVYGRLTERVAGHSDRIENLEHKVDDHGERIGRLEGGRPHGYRA